MPAEIGFKVITNNLGREDAKHIATYEALGGYKALRKALDMQPEAIQAEVVASNLRGRGGAGFPCGVKWGFVPKGAETVYLVCNADESEPGTCKDRELIYYDPHQLIEGMIISAYALRANHTFIYIRGEMMREYVVLQKAVEEAYGKGYLGARPFAVDYPVEIYVHTGAGAYICGEETALLNSLEGKRGEPRLKPPFPAQYGAFGMPTTVNNLETLVNIPWIVLNGGEAFAAIGTEGSTGPKLFCLSGHVGRPGVYEVPFGTTLGELLELAGGVPGGRSLKATLLGGAAGVFVGPESLDLPLTFEATRAAGATLGSGVVMAFDETADLVDTLARIARFFRDESCGQCVPCRVGTVRQEELLARLAAGSSIRTRDEELALLREMGQAMRDASICGLGQTASSAIESAVRQPGMVTL